MSEVPTAIDHVASVMKASYQAGSYQEVIKRGRNIIRLVGINQQDGRINDQEAENLLDMAFQPFRGDPKIWQAWWEELKLNVDEDRDENRPVLFSTFDVGADLIQARLLGLTDPEGIPSVNPVLEQIAAKYGLPTNPDVTAIMHAEPKPNPHWKGKTSEPPQPASHIGSGNTEAVPPALEDPRLRRLREVLTQNGTPQYYLMVSMSDNVELFGQRHDDGYEEFFNPDEDTIRGYYLSKDFPGRPLSDLEPVDAGFALMSKDLQRDLDSGKESTLKCYLEDNFNKSDLTILAFEYYTTRRFAKDNRRHKTFLHLFLPNPRAQEAFKIFMQVNPNVALDVVQSIIDPNLPNVSTHKFTEAVLGQRAGDGVITSVIDMEDRTSPATPPAEPPHPELPDPRVVAPRPPAIQPSSATQPEAKPLELTAQKEERLARIEARVEELKTQGFPEDVAIERAMNEAKTK